MESSVESGEPEDARAWNDLIIPITVPRSPTRVPRVVSVAMMGRFCERAGISRAVASSTELRRVVSFCSLLRTVLESISLYFTRVL